MRRAAFAAWASELTGLEVEACSSGREAALGADLICTTTSSREPVLLGEWLSEGAHVNAVGSSMPKAVELDAAAVARARLYIDRRESTLAESGDFLAAKAAGAVDDDHIVAELGDVLLGRAGGRRDEREITLFKSLGLAVQDLAAAHHVYTAATLAGRGTLADLGAPVDA